MAHLHGKSWTERTAAHESPETREYPELGGFERHVPHQSFSTPHSSLGIAGHVVHMGAMLFPVIAAELITDAVKYKKAVRIGSIATTVLYEGLYTMREAQRRDRQDAKLAECRSACAERFER